MMDQVRVRRLESETEASSQHASSIRVQVEENPAENNKKQGWARKLIKRGDRVVVPRGFDEYRNTRQLGRITFKRKWTLLLVLGVVVAVVVAVVWPAGDGTVCGPGQYFESQRVCINCPAGTYGEVGRDYYNASCQGQCEEGHFCLQGSTSRRANVCPVGHYCPFGTRFGQEFPCPNGTFGSEQGLTTPNCSGSCELAASYYCPPGSTIGDIQSQSLCLQGHYCDGSKPQPTPCPPGTFGNETGLNNAVCSGICPAGYFCPEGTVNPYPCPAGSFCETGSASPVLCPNGTYSGNELATSNATCTECPAGKHCPTGSTNATIPCPAGYYCVSGEPNPFEKPCLPGFFCPEGSTNPDMVLCTEGSYCPGATGPGPVPCPAGTFGNVSGSVDNSTCAYDCRAQYFCPPGTSESDMLRFGCPVGYFCDTGTPGEITKQNDGLFSVTPLDAYKCPGGYRQKRTQIPSLSGCFCNFTNVTGFDNDCDCPAGYFCPRGATFNDVMTCPFNHYCPLQTEFPIPCTLRGYYCPRFSSDPTFRTIRVEMSLFGLSAAISGLQDKSSSNHMVDLGAVALQNDAAGQFGGSIDQATNFLVVNGMPIFELERGLSNLRLDLNSRGAFANFSTTSESRKLWICKFDNHTSESVEKVYLVREFDPTSLYENPETNVNDTIFNVPRDFPVHETYAFCMHYQSGSNGRVTTSQKFSVVLGQEGPSQRVIVRNIAWSCFGFWVLFICSRRLRKRKYRPTRHKNNGFQRFAYYAIKYQPYPDYGRPLYYLQKGIGIAGVVLDGFWLTALAFNLASPLNCASWTYGAVEVSFRSDMVLSVMIVVLLCVIIPQLIDFYRYTSDHGVLPPADLNENRFCVVIRHFVLSPLLLEALFVPILAVLLHSVSGCLYFDRNTGTNFEFYDQVVWYGNPETICWWDNYHRIFGGLAVLLAFMFFRAAERHILDFKPELVRCAQPCIPSFDFSLLLGKTSMVTLRAMTTFVNLPFISAAGNMGILFLLFSLQVYWQPLYGTPYSTPLNDIRAGNLALAFFGSFLAMLSSIGKVASDVGHVQCWHIITLFVVGPFVWVFAALLSSKRSAWDVKRLKLEYLEWMGSLGFSIETERALETVKIHLEDYGTHTAFAHRLLQALGESFQRSNNPRVAAKMLEMEQFCLVNDEKLLNATKLKWEYMIEHVRDRIGEFYPPLARPVAAAPPTTILDIRFMRSALDRICELKFAGLGLQDAQVCRIVDSLIYLPNVKRMDLSQNAISGKAMSRILHHLCEHNVLKEINTMGNGQTLSAFELDYHLLTDALGKNTSLVRFQLDEKLQFEREFPELSFPVMDEIRKTKSGMKITLKVIVHRYNQYRNVQEKSWLAQFLTHLLKQKRNNCWFLDIEIGGGSAYSPDMKQEVGAFLSGLRLESDCIARVTKVKTFTWECMVQSDRLELDSTEVNRMAFDDAPLVLDLIRSMPNIRIIQLSPLTVYDLGRFEFMQNLIKALEMRAHSGDWNEHGLIVKVFKAAIALPVFSVGWNLLEQSLFSNYRKVLNDYVSIPIKEKDIYETPNQTMLKEQDRKDAELEEKKYPLTAPNYELSEGTSIIDCTNLVLTDADACLISVGLSKATNLREIRFQGNRIGDDGGELLVQTLAECDRPVRKLRKVSFGDWKSGNHLGPHAAEAMGKRFFGGLPCVSECKVCPKCLAAPPKLLELDLRNNDITGVGCVKLLTTNRIMFLQTLELCSNRIGNEGAIACASMLERNKSIVKLRLTRNEIGPLGAEALGCALKRNQTLQELYLDWNELGDEGIIGFASFFPDFVSLKVLAVENNMIGDMGMTGLAEGVSSPSIVLQDLFCGYNQIGDGGIVALSNALKTNRSICSLSLAGTEFTDFGAGKLADAVLVNEHSQLRNLDINKCTQVRKRGKVRLEELRLIIKDDQTSFGVYIDTN